MMEAFSIKSTHSDRELLFSKYDGEDFWVELKGGITASIRVYGYAPHSHDLAHWFSALGRYNEPWENELAWESFEGEFKISAKCTSLGHIHIMVFLRDLLGAHEEAFIQVGLETELGQLTIISNRARTFFAK